MLLMRIRPLCGRPNLAQIAVNMLYIPNCKKNILSTGQTVVVYSCTYLYDVYGQRPVPSSEAFL
jgi:hypothetical protein